MTPRKPAFVTDSALANALKELLVNLERRLELDAPLKAYLAGGMAVHLYTGTRVTMDVDAEFSARVHIPGDVVVSATLENGAKKTIYFDTNYNSTFALMHDDHQEDAIPLDLGSTHIRLLVLSPVDLAVSKIARFADNDKKDIEDLVRLGLTSSREIEVRAKEAMVTFVGGKAMLNANIRDAVSLARHAEATLRSTAKASTAPPTLGSGVLMSALKPDTQAPDPNDSATSTTRPRI